MLEHIELLSRGTYQPLMSEIEFMSHPFIRENTINQYQTLKN